MKIENKKLLIQGTKTFGVDLSDEAVEAFDLYLRELTKWNQKINLTAIRSEKEIVLRHFLDSLSVSPYLSGFCSLLDIGSGAGFPGIPLKIVHPSIKVTLIDSVRKKVDFQRHIIRALDLKGIKAVHGRIQDKDLVQTLAGEFDAVVSRAFSDLPRLLTLGYPFLKKGGVVVALKGSMRNGEVQLLSGKDEDPYRLKKMGMSVLPSTSLKKSILLFEKK